MNPLARSTSWPFAAVLILFAAVPGRAAAARELSTDRPDRTESAFTVEPGRIQVEVDALSFTRDRVPGVEFTGLALATTNLKLGVAEHSDLQVVFGPWGREEFESPGVLLEESGPTGLAVRWKQNLFGNDGGKYALALMPFLSTSLRERYEFDRMEGGLIVPLAIEGPDGWGFGLMSELDIRRDGTEDGHHSEVIFSATASHAIAGELSGYAEIWSLSSQMGDAPWQGTFDLGLTFGIGPDFQLDGGANFGLADATEDFTLFLGFSARR